MKSHFIPVDKERSIRGKLSMRFYGTTFVHSNHVDHHQSIRVLE
ncbi:9557_t:CDS:1, partial [Dentiscutata heterogama]